MVPEKSQLSVENQQQETKKAYRKPSVQVYGNLREMTQAANRTATNHQDGGAVWNTRT
jgi:hypothetical protein